MQQALARNGEPDHAARPARAPQPERQQIVRRAAEIPGAQQAQEGAGQEKGPGREHERRSAARDEQAVQRQGQPPGPLAPHEPVQERKGQIAKRRAAEPGGIYAVHALGAVQQRSPVVDGKFNEHERKEIESKNQTESRATVSLWTHALNTAF